MLPLDRQDRLRARYARLVPGYRHSGPIYEELLATALTPGSDVLDAGGGRSGVLGLYRSQVRRAVTVDLDLPSLRANETGADRVCGRLERLPFAGEQFDVVLCTWVVEHLPEPARAFAELARVLRPGGKLLILTPNALNYLVWANRLVPDRLRSGLVERVYARMETDTFQPFYRANTRGALDRQLGAVGLVPDRFLYVGDPSYLGVHPILFWFAVACERLTDLAPLRRFKAHLVARYTKLSSK